MYKLKSPVANATDEEKMEYAKEISIHFLQKTHTAARYLFYAFMIFMVILCLFKICSSIAYTYDFTSLQKMLLELGSFIVVLTFWLFKL